MKASSSYRANVTASGSGIVGGSLVWDVEFVAPSTYHVVSTATNGSANDCSQLGLAGSDCKFFWDVVWTAGGSVYHRACMKENGEGCVPWRETQASPLNFPPAGPPTAYLPVYPFVALDIAAGLRTVATSPPGTAGPSGVSAAFDAAAAKNASEQLTFDGDFGRGAGGVECRGPELSGLGQPTSTLTWHCAEVAPSDTMHGTGLIDAWLSASGKTIRRIRLTIPGGPGFQGDVTVDYLYSSLNGIDIVLPPRN